MAIPMIMLMAILTIIRIPMTIPMVIPIRTTMIMEPSST